MSGLELTRKWPRLRLAVPRQAVEEMSSLCFEHGSCGLETDEDAEICQLTAYFPVDADVAEVRDRLKEQLIDTGFEGITIEAGLEEERDWLSEWRRFFRPVWATPRIVVSPSWIPVATRPGEIAIAIYPEMAFGTGGHESTQLCLEAMEEALEEALEEAMEKAPAMAGACLDLGTGSGVLAIAAALLGARSVVALDVDPRAVENAERNIELNLGSSRLSLRRGDAAAAVRPTVLKGSVESVAGQRFDLILANLEGHLLRPILGQFSDLLTTDGVAVFSGLLAGEEAAFCQWVEEAGLSVRRVYAKGDWICCAAVGTSTAVRAGSG